MARLIRNWVPYRLTFWLHDKTGFWLDAWHVRGSRCGVVNIGPRIGKTWLFVVWHTERCYSEDPAGVFAVVAGKVGTWPRDLEEQMN